MLKTQTSLAMERPRAPSPVCNERRLRLQFSPSLKASDQQRILTAIGGLPVMTGGPLFVRALPRLTAHRGKLLSGKANRGTPVHAASFIRKREIVLETELLAKRDLALILVHEVFHFVWARLGNRKRAAYAALLAEERRARARGELGESSLVRKQIAAETSDYVCESFCDTAAWLYAPGGGKSRYATLGQRWRARREAWFAEHVSAMVKC